MKNPFRKRAPDGPKATVTLSPEDSARVRDTLIRDIQTAQMNALQNGRKTKLTDGEVLAVCVAAGCRWGVAKGADGALHIVTANRCYTHVERRGHIRVFEDVGGKPERRA